MLSAFTTEHLLITAASVLLTPIVLLILVIMVLASSNHSLGIREKYVEILLRIFEWGRRRIENKKARETPEPETGDDEEVSRGMVRNGSSVALLDRHTHAAAGYEAVLNFGRKAEKDFSLGDSYEFVKWGMEAITEDLVTQRFEAEEIDSWNLLTRTNMNYQYISLRLTVLWGLGFLFRYFVLLPIRLVITIVGLLWLLTCTAFVGYLPAGHFKKQLNAYVNLMCFRILSRGFSAIIRFHDPQYKAKEGGICVANHTTPIDVVILAVDNAYAMIGQSHGGFLGLIQRALLRASAHIWFERSETKDRMAVTRRIREHVAAKDNLPVLIFPEGTCINNTSVMMFKKGSFEVDCPIYPVAIKYDPRFGDAFWNSSQQSMVEHLIIMMTSWAIVCDVWYLPPMMRKEGEDAAVFAARVKNEIAKKGGLVELDWDGQLKRQAVKGEFKAMQQKMYSQRINRNE